MENLAYLYVLAEAEHQSKSDAARPQPAQQQERSQYPVLQTQATRGQHWLDGDCDRANQAYPTFYL